MNMQWSSSGSQAGVRVLFSTEILNFSQFYADFAQRKIPRGFRG